MLTKHLPKVLILSALILCLGFAACSNGTTSSGAHKHKWGEWTVTTPPGCTTAGEEARVCTLNAKHRETRPVSAFGHDWGEWEVTTPPTETEEGELTRICKYDASHKQMRLIAAHVHDWGEWVITPPGCTEEGVETRTCKTGGEKETRPGPAALGHNWGAWVETKAPTETEEGVETRTCSRCGETETNAIPAGVHNWSEWTETTAPTCTEEGIETRYCKDPGCNETQSRPGSAMLGHNWGDWTETKAPTCTEAGEETRVCSHDANHRETNPVDALGHRWGNWRETNAPTCMEDGEETRVCSEDSTHREKRSVTTDPSRHDWSEWAQTIPPACTLAGVETRVCFHNETHRDTRDGAAPLGHNWGGVYELLRAPTFFVEGEEAEKCTRDPSHFHETTRSIPKTEYITDAEEIAYLNDRPANDADHPVYLRVKIDLGTMQSNMAADSNWLQLLGAIEAGGKFVDLDLSACTLNKAEIYRTDYEESIHSRTNVSWEMFSPDRMVETGKDKIVTIVLPDTAKYIQNGTSTYEMFGFFTALRSFSGKGLTELGDYIFNNRTNLGPVLSLPPGLEYLNTYAFRACTGLTEVTIPASIKKIYGFPFYYPVKADASLVRVTFLGAKPPSMSSPAIFGSTTFNDNLEIFVPRGSLATYKAAFYNSSQNVYYYQDRIFESP